MGRCLETVHARHDWFVVVLYVCYTDNNDVHVCIGIAASFIVMLFPAKSGRKAVRLHNAALIHSLSHIYSTLMSIWIAGPPSTKGKDKPSTNQEHPITAPDSVLRPQFLAAMQQIKLLRGETMLARWEGSVRGSWPSEKYTRIVDAEASILTSLTQVNSNLYFIRSSVFIIYDSSATHSATYLLNGANPQCYELGASILTLWAQVYKITSTN
jgi:hypothetical protein